MWHVYSVYSLLSSWHLLWNVCLKSPSQFRGRYLWLLMWQGCLIYLAFSRHVWRLCGLIESNPAAVVVVLQEEFSVQPSDVEVAEGEVAVLNCGPPMGHPEPNVIWKNDGLPISTTDHHYTVSPLQFYMLISCLNKQLLLNDFYIFAFQVTAPFAHHMPEITLCLFFVSDLPCWNEAIRII